MKTLDLYKFIENNSVEWHREDNNGTPDVWISMYIFQVEEFHKLFTPRLFSYFEEGIDCIMRESYIVFQMKDICEFYDIELDEVFVDGENNA